MASEVICTLLESRDRTQLKLLRDHAVAAVKAVTGDPTFEEQMHKLVHYACTVQQNSILGGEPYIVIDVDGVVICTGRTVVEAVWHAIYKIETGEDMPDYN